MTIEEAHEVMENCDEFIGAPDGNRVELGGTYTADQMEAMAVLLRAGQLEQS